MQQQLAALPASASDALVVTALALAVLPLVAYIGRRLRTGRWRLVVGTKAWQVAVVLLVVCPMLAGFAGALSELVDDAQRLAGQDRDRASFLPSNDDLVIAELQRAYEVNLDLGYRHLPYSQEPVVAEVLSPDADVAGRSCEVHYDLERVRELTGSEFTQLSSEGLTPAEQADFYALLCDGQEVEPQGALLGVPVQTELVERSWPAQRVPRALVGSTVLSAGVGLVVIFMAYALPLVDRRGPEPGRGDALLADLRARIRRNPVERDRVVDGVVAAVHEEDAMRARLYATMPIEELLASVPDDAQLTDDALLTEYLVENGGLRSDLFRRPPETEHEAREVDLALERQRDTMAGDADERDRVRQFAAKLVDLINDEIRAQREAGLAGSFVPSEIDRDAVVLSDDVLREHLVASGVIDAMEMVNPGYRTYLRGFLWSFVFAPVIGLGAWVMSQDDGYVQWRYEPVVTEDSAAAFVAHYEALGIDVELPADREQLDPSLFLFRVEATRGADSCVGDVVSERALLQCGPSSNERSWT